MDVHTHTCVRTHTHTHTTYTHNTTQLYTIPDKSLIKANLNKILVAHVFHGTIDF